MAEENKIERVKDDVFKKSGLISLSDLSDSEYQKLFCKLETEQKNFLLKECEFRSPEYRWPSDALHHWGRIWEYPYVYYHIREQLKPLYPNLMSKIVDLGSGVTFFPYSVAKLGCQVHCLDIDPICATDIEKASSVVEHQPGKVDFRLISNGCFPLSDEEVDVLYCISVLEHVTDFNSTIEVIEEVFRVLKPNGLFILTIDIDLCGYMNMGIRRYYNLRKYLFHYFELQETERTVHPLDILQYRNGPYPYMIFSPLQKCKFYITQWIKPLFGKKPFHVLPNLAIWYAAMRKKSD